MLLIRHLFSEDNEYVFSEEEGSIITQEIGKLLDLKVMKQTHKQKEQILSPVFLRTKKDGGFRMTLDLKKLNRHINHKHFKMENLEQAKFGLLTKVIMWPPSTLGVLTTLSK